MEEAPLSHEIDEERLQLLQRLENGLELPMIALGFLWLGIMVAEFIWGLSRPLEILADAIWVIFVINFLLEFTLAPQKLAYLKRNWITVVALVLPAFRVLRVFRAARVLRAARAARGIRLFRIVSSLNRGMKALGETMGRRGFGYVTLLTVIVTGVGAAGMYTFEYGAVETAGLNTYPEALWWTAMLMTTLGSEYWPQTAEGRVLCFFLALYAFAVFGYVAATLTTFFVGRDAENAATEIPNAKSLEELKLEIQALRGEIRRLTEGG